jgi:hypothetical protein
MVFLEGQRRKEEERDWRKAAEDCRWVMERLVEVMHIRRAAGKQEGTTVGDNAPRPTAEEVEEEEEVGGDVEGEEGGGDEFIQLQE